MRSLAVFFADAFYRVIAKLEIVDTYTVNYVSRVFPFLWDTLHGGGVDVFYIIDNSFPDTQRFEAVADLFALAGMLVIHPYGKKGVRGFDEVASEIIAQMNSDCMIVYIEKDDSVNYLNEVMEIATNSDYLCIFRNQAIFNTQVEILGNQ